MRIAIALVVVLALSSSARAGNEVGVVVTGESSTQTLLTAQFQKWLTQHGHHVIPTPLPADAVPLLNDCFVMTDTKACLRSIIEKRATSTSTVYVYVKSTNNTTTGARDVALTAYWIDKGRDAHTESSGCDACTDEQLLTTADAVIKKLAGSLVGHVKLKSNPEGAQIAFDGQPPVGVTPLDVELPAGKHTIRMTKQDLEPQSRDVVLAADQTITVSMDLLPKPPDDGGSEPSRLLPIGLLAGGGVLIAGGVALIAINEDKSPELPKRIFHTTTKGIVVASVGAVVAAAGAYLLWFHSPDATSTPVAAITSDSAYVGWLGRF